jgi:CheY-like chemotaxis protein
MIEITTQLEANLASVSGEASALREMLTNLIFNAVDAMPSGGTITLSTQREGNSNVIKVSDAGMGMTEEVRRHCLEPFFSTKGERGTGLGLSMVIGIVQRHQGTLDIKSQSGEGTTFIISLPVADAAESGEDVRAQDDKAETSQALRLLVVDDEQPIRTLLATLLKREGHNVVTATEGNNALRLFKEQPFDLVITDKAMPEMNGDQLAKAVKKVSPRMPVILLTGFGEFIDKETLPEVDVLASKPFSIDSLREAIAAAITKKAA